MKEHYDEEAAQMKKSPGGKGTTVVNSNGEITAPEHLKKAISTPTYVSKASKK